MLPKELLEKICDLAVEKDYDAALHFSFCRRETTYASDNHMRLESYWISSFFTPQDLETALTCYCHKCREEVYRAESVEQLKKFTELGRCVVVVDPPDSEYFMGLLCLW